MCPLCYICATRSFGLRFGIYENTVAMDANRNLVVGIGEVLWDVLPQGKKLGGAPANFACHVSQFGLDSLVVSAVGDDAPGREMLECLSQRGLDLLVAKVPFPTGSVQVELDGDGIPRYDIRENVAWDNIPFSRELREAAGRTAAVCFGSLAQRGPVSRETINAFLRLVPDGEGVYKVFDINLRQDFYTEEILRSSMAQCNILKINDEELETVSRLFGYGDGDFRDRCRRLVAEFGLRMLVLTCGVNGSYVFSGGGVSFVGTPKVEVADTVGAGDSFTAAFVSALLRGRPVCEAHRLAVDVSAFVCSREGAMPKLGEELVGRIR